MAFVNRSERNTMPLPENNDIGPGLYISPEIHGNNLKPNRVPFQTNVFRDFKIKKDISNIGPGYYYKDDRHEKFLKYINKDEEMKKSPIYRSIEFNDSGPLNLVGLEDLRERKGFLSKDKRFKSETLFDELRPGPGSYNHDVKTSPQLMNRNKPMKDINHELLMQMVKSPNRITSIPTKEQCYGYEVRSNGSVSRMNDNPDKHKLLQGTILDSAGPGQYDIQSPDTWLKKKGTQWSKYKCERYPTKSKPLNMSNIEDQENTNEKRIKEELIKEKTKLEKAKMHKQFKEHAARRRSLANEFHNSPNILENVTKMESPGPGYYIDIYNHSGFKRSPIPEKLQKFNSSSQRFPEPNISMENIIGPGAYFNEERVLNKKSKENKSPFNSRQNRDNPFTSASVETPGPSSYNPSKFVDTKAVSKKCIFGSSEIRIKEKKNDKTVTPGPGSYLALEKWNKVTANDILKMMKPRYKEDQSIIPEEDKVESVPPVGSYNADIQNSMSYQIEKKNNRFTSVKVPFNSINKRFRYKAENEKVGPGSYDLSTEKRCITGNPEFHAPFGSGDQRLKEAKTSQIASPGLYNSDSYFNWNKKSYNILYYQ